MLIEQDITCITIGAYIEKITLQTGSFRLTQSEWVKNEVVINKLIELGIQRVLVDTEKFDAQMAADAVTLNSIETKRKHEFKVKMTQAKALISTSKDVQKKIFKHIEEGLEIDLCSVKTLTTELIDTLFTDSDALMCAINIRNKDEYLLEHSFSVSMLMALFSRYLGIDKTVIRELAIGAFLHDIGKIRTPDHILNKPGKLTSDEFGIMKLHVNHSIDIIKSIPGISKISSDVAAIHHEKLNGEGYPYGLIGQQISRFGRMLSICDIYDALTANRCYKEGLTQLKSFGILRSLAQDGQLDLDLVHAFIKCMGVYPVGSLVKLNSNRLAIVEGYNKADPIRPKVNSFYSLDKQDFELTNRIDLSMADDEISESVRADDFDLDMEEIMRFLVSEA
ncbi:HD-GYP domain-containing protein [Moritella viscosa]|uniref:HD domain protein n=1 Tax=Moritella viscosa TaxID=80854 RepID=A0A090IBS1_9GAMM|nr:HD-GYP domain-containing protein [Moritella viscosa]CED59311.1 metal dependent phosphohydrolase [Moritella viscosa]SGY85676.1 HD domain protein [Moritella viscosa]SGY86894.1 HD domain protein [Moritella viscosa]SGY86937.1 HD domain protein [Moritella viscosa]SGY88239.1 HD domain protein [Moritella viscosa]